MTTPRRLFALDENFPQPILAVLQRFMTEAELVPVGEIDPRLRAIFDWQILLALYNHERAWDGLITTDSGMLKLPKELSVLRQTKLTLVVPLSAGHDPLKATGLVLSHLPAICKKTRSDAPQIWRLSARARKHEDPWKFLEAIAGRHGKSANTLFKQNKASSVELATNPLELEE